MIPLKCLTVMVCATVLCCPLSKSQSAAIQPSTPSQIPLCDVTQDPQRYQGMRVRIRASFETDGLEHSILTDSRCKRGIVPWIAEQVEHDPGVEALDRAVAKGRRGTIDKRIVGTFTGTIVYQEKPAPSGTLGLEIEKIEDLQVTTKRPSRSRKNPKNGPTTGTMR